MQVAVWDTYVQRENGSTMHFDILVPDTLTDTPTIYKYGRDYLSTKPFKTGALAANECRFCHIEQAPEAVVEAIVQKGFYIIELENCL